MNTIKGRVHKYNRDNIDTDVIIPGPYLKIHDPVELARHAMEGIDPNFHKIVSPGDLLLCGGNFGCGSSREHAPIALSTLGIKAILAPSFARIFYRNAIDGGYLLPIEIERSTLEKIDDKNLIDIDFENNKIINLDKGDESYSIKPLSDMIVKIIEAGGLLYYTDDSQGTTS